jgi:hypothetical protein
LPLASLSQATCPAAELRSTMAPTFDFQDETSVDPGVAGVTVLPTEASQCITTVADDVAGSAGSNASDTIAGAGIALVVEGFGGVTLLEAPGVAAGAGVSDLRRVP